MIDANKILQADALDLIFEGRNKEYGAYELRTNYRKRLTIAVGSMLLLCGCMVLLNSFTGKSEKKPRMVVTNDVILDDVAPKERQPEPPPVEPPKPKQQIQMIKNVVPIIAPDKEVDPKDVPPTVDEMTDVKIGPVDQDGVKGDDVVAPPNDGGGTQVIQAPPKHDEDEDKIWVGVQIESEYPGGRSSWVRFLTKTLPRYYTDDYVERNLQGKVIVQFVVDQEGNVSDVKGIEGPKELWEIAEKVIRMSGKWTAAIQNGHKVKSYKRQPITFTIDPQE